METRVEDVANSRLRPPAVLDTEVSEIRLLLQEYAGVVIDKPSEMVAEIVAEFLTAQRLASAAELIPNLRAGRGSCESLLERLLPGDTGFFRNPEVFQKLRREVLPALAGKSDDNLRRLRMWSAGCSTGEEAYSIGISVCEALQDDTAGWNVHIVAGDIRREALKVAERGLYPASSLLHVPGHLVATYFAKVGDHFLVKPRLRNLVTFAHMNLTEPAFIGRFDCIFCLDVLPQLSASGRAALAQRLHLSLEPGGYLFLGAHDQLPAGTRFLRHIDGSLAYYQRPLAAAAKAGN